MKNENDGLNKLQQHRREELSRLERAEAEAAAQRESQNNDDVVTQAEADFQKQLRNNPKPFGRS